MAPANRYTNDRNRDISAPIDHLLELLRMLPELLFYSVLNVNSNPFFLPGQYSANSTINIWRPFIAHHTAQHLGLERFAAEDGNVFYVFPYMTKAQEIIGNGLDKVCDGTFATFYQYVHHHIITEFNREDNLYEVEPVYHTVNQINDSNEFEYDRPRYCEEILAMACRIILEAGSGHQPLLEKIFLYYCLRCNGTIKDGFQLDHKLRCAIADVVFENSPSHRVREPDTELPTVVSTLLGNIVNEWIRHHHPQAHTFWHPDSEMTFEAVVFMQRHGGLDPSVQTNIEVRPLTRWNDEVTLARHQQNYPVPRGYPIIQACRAILQDQRPTWNLDHVTQEDLDKEKDAYEQIRAINGCTAADGYPNYPRIVKDEED